MIFILPHQNLDVKPFIFLHMILGDRKELIT